mgnify:CR=1 FL=1
MRKIEISELEAVAICAMLDDYSRTTERTDAARDAISAVRHLRNKMMAVSEPVACDYKIMPIEPLPKEFRRGFWQK